MKFSLLDTVALTENLPQEDLSCGMVGVIVDIYHHPNEAYEVEFCDNLGRTIAQLALPENQLRKQS